MNATHNIAPDLNAVLNEYMRLSGLSDIEVLSKQGGKLGRAVSFRLKQLSKAKGEIRTQLLARLKAGGFIRIRPSVMEKAKTKITAKMEKAKTPRGQTKLLDLGIRSNAGQSHYKSRVLMQEAVMREIGLRESGRGVLGFSARYPNVVSHGLTAISRYQLLFSQVGIRYSANGKSISFHWPGTNKQSRQVAEGMEKPRATRAVNAAIDDVRADVLVYVLRKQAELASGFVRKTKSGVAR